MLSHRGIVVVYKGEIIVTKICFGSTRHQSGNPFKIPDEKSGEGEFPTLAQSMEKWSVVGAKEKKVDPAAGSSNSNKIQRFIQGKGAQPLMQSSINFKLSCWKRSWT